MNVHFRNAVMNLPFFRTDYHFWVWQQNPRLTVVRAYTQARTPAVARALGRSSALAAAELQEATVEYLLGTTVAVPGVTAPKAAKVLA